MKRNYDRYYIEGQYAHAEGVDWHKNPYINKSRVAYGAWDDGWRDAEKADPKFQNAENEQ